MPTRRSRSNNIVGVVLDGDDIRGTLRDGFGSPRVVACAVDLEWAPSSHVREPFVPFGLPTLPAQGAESTPVG